MLVSLLGVVRASLVYHDIQLLMVPGVIGALVKTDEQEVINFLLTTEIIPLCLRIMESGSELSKTVATFILQKILLDETGLYYICQTYDRFSHVAMILGKMVIQLSKEPSQRLLKHVVRCYLRLSDNTRACEALCQCLPDQLKVTSLSLSLWRRVIFILSGRDFPGLSEGRQEHQALAGSVTEEHRGDVEPRRWRGGGAGSQTWPGETIPASCGLGANITRH